MAAVLMAAVGGRRAMAGVPGSARPGWYRWAVRIVSLLPSATEILFAVGAGDEVVGVTFECDFPEEARSRRIVSTTALPPGLTPSQIDATVRSRIAAGEDLYALDEGALGVLDPDLIVTQDLCAVCAVDIKEVDAALEHLGCRADVLTLDPMTLDEVLASIGEVGRATGRESAATAVVLGLRARLESVARATAGRARPDVTVLEWTDPPFASGHWVPDMVAAAGGRCALGAVGEPLRTGDVGRGGILRPGTGRGRTLRLPAGRGDGVGPGAGRRRPPPPGVPVWAVDADAAFVRPGPRLVDGVEALAAIVHPGAVPLDPGLAVRV